MTATFRQYALLLLVALILLGSQLLLRQGAKGGPPLSVASPADLLALIWRVLTTPLLLLGYALSAGSSLLWLIVLSRLELSYATPIMNGFFYLLLLLASTFILREQITAWRWLGTLFVLIGIALISRSR
jgi:multidrug transporter EmrE-like cation transporter